MGGLDDLETPYEHIQPDESYCTKSTSTCNFFYLKESVEDNCSGRVIVDDIFLSRGYSGI